MPLLLLLLPVPPSYKPQGAEAAAADLGGRVYGSEQHANVGAAVQQLLGGALRVQLHCRGQQLAYQRLRRSHGRRKSAAGNQQTASGKAARLTEEKEGLRGRGRLMLACFAPACAPLLA